MKFENYGLTRREGRVIQVTYLAKPTLKDLLLFREVFERAFEPTEDGWIDCWSKQPATAEELKIIRNVIFEINYSESDFN